VIDELGDVTVAASDEMEKFHSKQGSPPPRQVVVASMIIEDAFHAGFGALTVESVSQVRHPGPKHNAHLPALGQQRVASSTAFSTAFTCG
jgi:hypothetical protein